MFYTTLVVLSSTYTILALLLIIVWYYLKLTRGIHGSTATINKLAGSRNVVAFEIYSYLCLVAWIVLALPFIDLITFEKMTSFDRGIGGGINSYLGHMTNKEKNLYFILTLVNILGAKASWTLAKLSDLLRRGRVIMIPCGMFYVCIEESSLVKK